MRETDTIFAKATGAGRAGVAVYRLSGPEARKIIRSLTGDEPKPRKANYRKIIDPEDGQVIDHGLAILFPAPNSFTGEDVVEFHLHGGSAICDALEDVVSRLGARPAEAGEFTFRSLKNGKRDLAQAEAIADLVDAETNLQRMQALRQLEGGLSHRAEAWRGLLLSIFSPLEAAIDFPDEGDVPEEIAAKAAPKIRVLIDELTEQIELADKSRAIRTGIDIALIGAPNAGKSSLINSLAGSDVAIVSDIPGTTRDVLETRISLNGILTTLFDTAGLRNQYTDEIEEIGIKRALTRAKSAHTRVLVVDGSFFVSRETSGEKSTQVLPKDALDLLRPTDLIVWNKSDLAPTPVDLALDQQVIATSTKTGDGIAGLIEALTNLVASDTQHNALFTRRRHVEAAKSARDSLHRALTNLAAGPEVLAEDVRLAARALGSITGTVGVEDILGDIFSKFCIGK